MKKLLMLTLFISLLLAGCRVENKGNFQIYLTDQPFNIEEADHIWVTISDIKVHKTEEGFLNVGVENPECDLLQLRNEETILVDTELEKGTYTQIRLVVESGKIVINGETYNLTIPSSEVKIPVVFHVLQGGQTEILLDFDAQKSIMAVSAGVSNQYILRPVIKVENIRY